MAAEQGTQVLPQDRPPQAFMVLGGSLASDRGMRKMAQPFGPFAVAFNSEISFDPPQSSRYAQQSGFLAEQLGAGRDVVLLPDTTGLQSLGLMLDHEGQGENGPVINQSDASHVTVVASEPVLFRKGLVRGTVDRAKFTTNVVRLLTSPTVKGINAVIAFPPESVTDAELTGFMGKRWVQSDPTVRTIDVPRQSSQRERPEEIADQLAQNDKELKQAAENGKKHDGIRAVKRRGKIAAKHVQHIFDGKDIPDDTTEGKRVSTSTLAKAALPLVRRVFKGTANEDIRQLAEQGARVILAPFQHDRVGSLKAAVSLRDELARDGIKIEVVEFKRLGNAGLALDHWAYADAVKGLVFASGPSQ